MSGEKRYITFLTDDAPLKNKGAGISVLLFNILSALENNYKLSVITFGNRLVDNEEIYADNTNADVFICDKLFEKVYPILRFGIFRVLFQFISFWLLLPSLIKRNNFSGNLCVTMVGASMRPVCKAWFLMKFAKKAKHCLYIVDDLELINEEHGNKLEVLLFKVFFKRTISRADLLINITEGLKEKYKNRYGKDSVVMFPHFKKTSKLPSIQKDLVKSDYTFVFTGGLSFLYNDSLTFFADALKELNQQNVGNFKLIIQTYSPYKDFEALNFDHKYVSFSTSENRSDLLIVYQKSDCFLVPYSFEKSIKPMVTTSFPQKIAEIIQYGKRVLLFGPDYSSVGKFFIQNDLPYSCNVMSMPELKETIVNCANDSNSNSILYLNAYERYMSANAVVSVFNAIF